MSKSPRTPKDIKVRRSVEVGDTIMIPVVVTGKRPLTAGGTVVPHEMLTIRIPGSTTPVTVRADALETYE